MAPLQEGFFDPEFPVPTHHSHRKGACPGCADQSLWRRPADASIGPWSNDPLLVGICITVPFNGDFRHRCKGTLVDNQEREGALAVARIGHLVFGKPPLFSFQGHRKGSQPFWGSIGTYPCGISQKCWLHGDFRLKLTAIQQRDLMGTLLYDSEFDLGVTSLASVYLLMACGPSNIGTNRLGAARTCHSQDSPPSLLQLGLVIFSFPSVVAS